MPSVYRIETPRLCLRCWSGSDAPALTAAIEASLEHLLPWMPWARGEPEPLARKAARLRRFRRSFELGKDFIYGVFARQDNAVLGGVGMHRRIGAGAGEIGYWIHADHAGQGLGTEAAGALARVGFEVTGFHRIEIHCDPRNEASVAIARKLGFTLQVTVPGCVTSATMAPRDTMIWTMLRKDFPSSPAASTQVEAFDADGEKIL